MANLKDIIVNGTSRFIGKVFGPTPSEGDYSKQLATTEYVIDNSANQSISNLTEEGESKINASKCLLTNTIVTDPTAYNAVKSYSQDSFDLSKFEVVGSPTITDDGVASGFSSSNYLIPNVNFNSTANVEFLFKNVYIVISNSPTNYDLFFGSSNGTYAKIGWHKKARTLSLYSGSEWVASSYVLSVNTFYDFKLNWNGTTYSLYAKLSSENEWIYVTSFDNSNNVLYSNLWIGRNSTNTGEIFSGSIDLKQFSITVDGVEVFSGNKTGIDAIKPLDAEELGDVYVNEHGIVENFNVNNAIKAPISFNPVSTVKIRSLLTWNTGSAQPKDGINVPYVFGPNKWRLEVTSTNIHATNDLDTSTNTAFNITIPELQNGNVIEIIETITIGTRTVKVIINETDEYSGSTTFAANQAFSTSELAIGNAAFDGSSEYFWNGAINLNMFIVYIDGKLTYEPCLYIPYTQSKTGSKIVENVYRNRVYELYDQTGKAEYYTLDTENENITLPLGEIYGLITSKADTVNVANKSLEDLTDDGNALINNSKAWITGKLTDDKTTYDSIEKLSVSTFNKDNFTVEGSPNITENGIVTNLSTTNLLKSTYYGLDDEFIVQTPAYTITNIATEQYIITYGGGNFRLLISNTGRLTLGVFTASDGYETASVANVLQVGATYIFKVKRTFDGTNYTYTVYYKELGEEYKIAFTSVVQAIYSVDVPVQIGGLSTSYPFLGSIDLKYYYLINSGALIVCGNKTELDVIKADNFEVVNTGRTIYAYVYNDGSVNHTIYANSATAPTTLYNEDGTAYTGTDFTVADNVVSYSGNTCTYTAASNITLYINITDDGVASGFSTSNYLLPNLGAISTQNFELDIKYKTSSSYTTGAINTIFYSKTLNANETGLQVYINKLGLMKFDLRNNDASIKIDDRVFVQLAQANTEYNIKIKITNGSLIEWFVNGTKVGEITTTQTNYGFLANYYSLGVRKIGNTAVDRPFNGSIDLNDFKIYADGNLVYQPCLKIPYTESKTGSKIVDATYYDRVIDVYEQYGSAYYYTLDRQNGLSSLPFGDIYGLMMKKDDSPDYFSADTPPEFPFIAWREGYINVTVPANEKLLINDNEVVSAGTSAVQMQLRVGLYDNITFSNTNGATLTFYPCKGVLYTI